jgi:replicative DNA helicase
MKTSQINDKGDIMENAQNQKDDTSNVSTGISSLHALMGGGFCNGELVVLAGRPSSGKTAFVVQLLLHLALEKEIPVLLFSIEMSKEIMGKRMISALAGIGIADLDEGEMASEDWPGLASAGNVLSKAPIYINDSANISVSKIGAIGRSLKKKHGIGLIIVDYLQLMEAEPSAEDGNSTEKKMEHLKDMARELQIPVLILSQISRSDYGNARPTILRLIQQGNIEPHTDKILFIHRTGQEIIENGDSEQGTEAAKLILAKNTNGPTGSIELGFRKFCGRFKEI